MRAALDEDDYDIAIIGVLLPGGEDSFALAETANLCMRRKCSDGSGFPARAG